MISLFHTSLAMISRDVGTKAMFTATGRRELQGSPWGGREDQASLLKEIKQEGALLSCRFPRVAVKKLIQTHPYVIAFTLQNEKAFLRLRGIVCVQGVQREQFSEQIFDVSLSACNFHGRWESHLSAKGNIYLFHSAALFTVAMVACCYNCLLLKAISFLKTSVLHASCQLSGSSCLFTYLVCLMMAFLRPQGIWFPSSDRINREVPSIIMIS